MATDQKEALVLWFDEIGIKDVPLVGGKNASLGEMYQELTPKGVNIPNGFAITAYAYQYLIKSAGIEDAIRNALDGLDTHDMKNLQERGEKASYLQKFRVPKKRNWLWKPSNWEPTALS